MKAADKVTKAANLLDQVWNKDLTTILELGLIDCARDLRAAVRNGDVYAQRAALVDQMQFSKLEDWLNDNDPKALQQVKDALADSVDTGIKVGDRVRSYDFSYKAGFYVEGIVEAITEGLPDHPCKDDLRYQLKVDRGVFQGIEDERRNDYTCYPPVNGRPTLFGQVTDGVHRIG